MSQAVESLASEVSQNLKGLKLSGLMQLYSTETTQPITGKKVCATVYGISAQAAREMMGVKVSIVDKPLNPTVIGASTSGSESGTISSPCSGTGDNDNYIDDDF